MKVYIGWDPRDELAFRACVSSMLAYSSIPLTIIPLREHELRNLGLYRRSYIKRNNGQMFDVHDTRPFSTEFTFTRFFIPHLAAGPEPVLFCDADMLWRDDIAKLLTHAKGSKALWCVQHQYKPEENIKMDGVIQACYRRKNWSSLMLMRPGMIKISEHDLNTKSGRWLHGMEWLEDSMIGALPERWNWLEGWSTEEISPSVVHYTRGTPDMHDITMVFEDEWWQAVNEWHPGMNQHGIKDTPAYRPYGTPPAVVRRVS